MANIIRFPAEAAMLRRQARLVGGRTAGQTGEIVIFTGVRYSRNEDDNHAGNGASTGGKRKRRAKAS